jgi:hypothetical protein
VLVTGFVVGLGIRLVLLPYKGTFDMVDYADWGRQVRSHGLHQSFVLYPLVNQLFAAEVWLASTLHVPVWAGLKLGTLLFDVTSFFLLVAILSRLGADRRWALVYWLHPYFLALFWLGYIDVPVGTFILLGILLVSLRSRLPFNVAAGGALGLALMQKPQALTVVAAVGGLLAAVAILFRRSGRSLEGQLLGVLAGVVGVFACYAAYFYRLGYGWTHLFHGYRPHTIAGLSAGLSGHMLNIWFPFAVYGASTKVPDYAVTKPAVANTIGSVLVAIGFVAAAFVVARRSMHRPLASSLLLVTALWTLILPMVGTHAHENHLFYGLLLSLPLVASRHDLPLRVGYHVLLAANAINLFCLYLFGLNHLSNWSPGLAVAHLYRPFAVQLVVTACAIAAWLVVLIRLSRSALAVGSSESGDSGLAVLH